MAGGGVASRVVGRRPGTRGFLLTLAALLALVLASAGQSGAATSSRGSSAAEAPTPLVRACQHKPNGVLYTTASAAACASPWKYVSFSAAHLTRICVSPGQWIWLPNAATACSARPGFSKLMVPAPQDTNYCAPHWVWPIRYVQHAGNCFPNGHPLIILGTANHPPTNLVLSHASVPEGQPAGTLVGTLSTVDADSGQTFTYSLVSGSGSGDNASFQISGNQLQTHAPLTPGPKYVRIQTSDGHGGTFQRAFTIAVTGTNHAPTDLALSNQSVAENQPSGTTVGTFSTTDADAGDTFTYSLVSGAGSTDNGSFHITGAQLQTSASFDYESKSSYSIRAQTSDGHGGTFQKQFTITVTNAAEAPVVTTSAGTTAYFEGAPAAPVDGSLTVSDPDSANLASAQVRISAGFESGDDLVFVNTASISGVYNTGTGVLTLTGTDTVANYQAALRSVAYDTSSDNPSASKTVEFKVNDGGLDSNAATKGIAITGVNDAPTVATSSGSASYTEGDSAAAVDPGVTVTDPDSPNLAGATASITSNFTSADGDTLNFTDQNGISGSYNSATGVLTLTGVSSVANYQTALQSITFSLTSTNPSTSTRTVSFKVSDGGADSNTATRDVTVAASNDAPVVATTSGDTAYTEGGSAATVDGSLTVTDADDTNLESAQVRISAGFDSGDSLNFSDQNGISGTYTAGTGVLALSGSASVADYQTALRSITFSSTSDNPTASKTVEFKANDGDADSNAATKDISVTGANDAPTVTTSSGWASYTENGPSVAVDSAVTVTDPDSAQLQGATATISANFSAAEGDTLNFSDQNGITGSYNSGAGVLTLSGNASVADYQTALQSITFSLTSDNPSTQTRTVSFQVTDTDGADSNTATRSVTVAASNDPPVVATSAGNTAYTEADPAVTIDGSVTASDSDNSNLESGQVRVSVGFSAGDDLQFVNQNGISGVYNTGTGVLTLTGSSSWANYQTALRSIKFFTPTTNTETSKTIEFKVNDGSADSNLATKTIDITPANAAPVAADVTLNGTNRAVGNTSLIANDPTDGAPTVTGPAKSISYDLLSQATDDGPSSALTITAATDQATAHGGKVTIESDGDFTYLPPKGYTGSDSFTYQVNDNDPASPKSDMGTVTVDVQNVVWYVDGSASAPPSATAGESVSPLTSLAGINGAGGVGDADGSSDTIFLYQGTYSGGLPLEANQTLFSERHGLVVTDGGGGAGTVTLVAAGGANAEVDGGLVLATGNAIQGINLGTSGAAAVFALSGASVGSATMDTVTDGNINNPAGGGVSITGSGNVLNMQFTGVTAAGGTTNGIALAGASGTFHASGGSLTATGTDVSLSGGSSNFTYDGTVNDATGQLVSISGETGGTKSFTGALSGTGGNASTGISLSSNTGATIAFTGGVALSTGVNPTLSATGGGTVSVTGTNTLASTTGTPLTVTGTTIGAGGLNFQSIGSNGAASGIVLNGTGATAGLTVTGTGSAGTGGTITNSSNAGIALTSTKAPSFSWLNVTNGGDDGIRAVSVDGLTLAHDSITGNGNAAGENGLDANSQTGTVTINNSTVSGSADTNADIFSASSGTLGVSADTSTFSNTSVSTGSDGLHVETNGSTNATVSVTGSTFVHNRGDQFQFTTDSTATGTNNVTFTGNTLTGDRGMPYGGTDLGGGVTISPDKSSTTHYTIANNSIQGATQSGILVDLGANSTAGGVLRGTISGNSVGIAATVDSGSSEFNDVSITTDGAGGNQATITGNTLVQYGNAHGIQVLGRNGTNNVDVTITGNTISTPGSGASTGIFAQDGANATDNTTMCSDIGGAGALANSLSTSGAAANDDIRFRQVGASSSIRLPGYGGTSTDTAAVDAYVAGRNGGNGVPTVSVAAPLTGGFLGGSACNTP